MSQSLALSIISSFALVMIAFSAVRRYSRGLDLFLVSERRVGTLVGAMSIAATWIWAPSLFIAAQKSYQQGLPGILWFTVPNVACLMVFALFAVRIRTVLPHGYTFPEYIAHRYDRKTHLVYLFAFLALQVCSLAVQLIAGASLLNSLSGMPYAIGVIVIAVVFTSYSLIDGLHSSIRTEVLQLLIIWTGIAILVPLAVIKAGGITTVLAGLGGVSGKFTHAFDADVAYSFGITVTIGLMSGPVGDQKFWMRAFALREGSVVKGFLLGAMFFGIVPVVMSLLGFVAAGNHEAAAQVVAGSVPAQQVGPEVIRNLLPAGGLILFVLVVLSSLASTGGSAICAGGSLVAVDVYRTYRNPGASNAEMLKVARGSVLALSIAAVGIALVPGITILGLFLFYGTLRSSTLIPTILTLYMTRIPSWGIFWGVTSAIALGVPTYFYGELSGNVHVKVMANIGILVISAVFPVIAQCTSRRNTHEVSQMPD
jgi:urea-proton symporter